jgi:hypothetical protein
MNEGSRRGIVQCAAVAGVAFLWPAISVALPMSRPSPYVTLNGTALCGPCHPTAMITGAEPNSSVNLTIGVWTGEGFAPRDFGTVGVTDAGGELLALPLPDSISGPISVSVEIAGQRSQPVIAEYVAFCPPPPIHSGPPILCPSGPLHAAIGQAVAAPGQPVTMSVSGAPAFATLGVVVEKLAGREWATLAEGLPAVADCHGQSEISLETTMEPGLYRAWAVDAATGAPSGIVYYQVQDCAW